MTDNEREVILPSIVQCGDLGLQLRLYQCIEPHGGQEALRWLRIDEGTDTQEHEDQCEVARVEVFR